LVGGPQPKCGEEEEEAPEEPREDPGAQMGRREEEGAMGPSGMAPPTNISDGGIRPGGLWKGMWLGCPKKERGRG
jgi:hypothetical protein